MPRLIWVFAGRTTTLLVLSWGGCFIACYVEAFTKRFIFILFSLKGTKGCIYNNTILQMGLLLFTHMFRENITKTKTTWCDIRIIYTIGIKLSIFWNFCTNFPRHLIKQADLISSEWKSILTLASYVFADQIHKFYIYLMHSFFFHKVTCFR